MSVTNVTLKLWQGQGINSWRVQFHGLDYKNLLIFLLSKITKIPVTVKKCYSDGSFILVRIFFVWYFLLLKQLYKIWLLSLFKYWIKFKKKYIFVSIFFVGLLLLLKQLHEIWLLSLLKFVNNYWIKFKKRLDKTSNWT